MTPSPQHAVIESRCSPPLPARSRAAHRASLVASAVLAIALLGGCLGTSAPVAFYVMEPLPGPVAGALPAPMSLGLGTLALPALLDRPQIVTELDANRVDLSEHHRWAEELAANVRRVLAQNLASRVTGIDVLPRPSARLRPDLGVELNFVQFGGQLGGGVHLAGSWRLHAVHCPAVLAPATPFAIAVATAGPGYAEFVAALEQGLGQLSDLMAAQILAVASCPG